MVRLLKLFILLGLICCSSCGYNTIPKYVIQNFIYCYDSIDTSIDTMINIEGYYNFVSEDCSNCHLYLMFYKDGTYVEGFYHPRNESIQSYFETMVNNDLKALCYFHLYNDWGRYTINGDTIKLQAINRPVRGSTSAVWWINEIWFKIIDKNTIIGIFPNNNPIRYPDDFQEKYYMKRYGSPAKFTPLSVRPNSNCWLKREKWFWCKEQDWKDYKKKMGQKKIKKK